MALENEFYFNFQVLSQLPNRKKARKLLKFAVFDIFLAGGRYLLLLIFEDIYNMYRQYFAEIAVNPTCVFPKSATVHGTADIHCLFIDTNKKGKLAPTNSCYDDLSCKS